MTISGVVVGLVTLVFGGFLTFAGQRLFRILLPIWGFIFGWLLAYTRNVFIWLFIRRVKKKASMWRVRNFLEYI